MAPLKAAVVTDIKRLRKKSLITVTRLAARYPQSIRLGRRCTLDAAIPSTIDIIATGGVELLFARVGIRLRDFLRIWEIAGNRAYQSTALITMGTTNPAIAGGQRRGNRPLIEGKTDDARVKIKVAADLYPFEFIAIRALPKKSGGGWAEEMFS